MTELNSYTDSRHKKSLLVDETNKLAINDGFQAASASHLHPVTTVLSHAVPDKLSGDVGLPKEHWAMIGNWLEEGMEWEEILGGEIRG